MLAPPWTPVSSIPAGVEESDALGDAGLVNEQGLGLLDPSDAMSSAAIYLTDDAPPDIADRLSAELGGAALGPPDRPGAIVNLDRVRDVPLVIVAVIGAMSVVSLAQIVATSVRRRRRDLAVLRALGAATRWRRRVVHWHATALCLATAAIATPLGVVVGRVAYRRYPDDIEAPIRAEIPVL